jgi:hypothetical protein
MTKTNDDVLPKWTYKNVTLSQARFFRDHLITRIDYKTNITADWQSECWVVLTGITHNQKQEANIRFPAGSLPHGVVYNPSFGRGLLQLDKDVINAANEIDDWHKRHNKDVKEFNRLKEKLFG